MEQLAQAKETEEAQYAAMKKRIQFMYEKRDFVMMEMLFGAASFSDLLNRNDYIEQLAEYDREQLEIYQATRVEIEEKEAQLEQEKQELDELKVSVEAEQSRVAGLVSQTSGKISSYQNEIQATEAEMREYEKQLQEQKTVLQNYRRN